MNRRTFVVRVAGHAAAPAALTLLARRVHAQALQAPGAVDTSNLFAMDQSASRPVRLPPKPGSRVVVNADERDTLEHRIRCQCSCQVSPAMHRDMMSLVSGGYGAQEIIDAFVGVYGERVLMAPRASGFNLLGWIAPFAVLGGGAILVAGLLRSWRRTPRVAPVAPVRSSAGQPSEGTDEELARLDAAVRDDG
jgi:cytochrome c-type biogenesis protein CcmH